MQSDFAQGFVNAMLGWMRSLAAAVANMFRSGSGAQSGGFSIVEWFKGHWVGLLITLILLGVLADWVVWLLRWRPYWLWFKKRRIVLDDADDQPVYEPTERFHSRALRYDDYDEYDYGEDEDDSEYVFDGDEDDEGYDFSDDEPDGGDYEEGYDFNDDEPDDDDDDYDEYDDEYDESDPPISESPDFASFDEDAGFDDEDAGFDDEILQGELEDEASCAQRGEIASRPLFEDGGASVAKGFEKPASVENDPAAEDPFEIGDDAEKKPDCDKLKSRKARRREKGARDGKL